MATKTVKKKPSKAVVAPLEATAEAVSKAVNKTVSKATSAAAKGSSVVPFIPMPAIGTFTKSTPSFGGCFNSMESVMSNYKDQYEKMTGDSAATLRQGIESCVKSSSTFAKGAEQMMKTLMEVAQESGQRNSEAMKALMASRTLNEFAEAQNKLAQQNFDDAMSTATKLSEMTIKLCTEALEPITAEVTKATKKATEKFAA